MKPDQKPHDKFSGVSQQEGKRPGVLNAAKLYCGPCQAASAASCASMLHEAIHRNHLYGGDALQVLALCARHRNDTVGVFSLVSVPFFSILFLMLSD